MPRWGRKKGEDGWGKGNSCFGAPLVFFSLLCALYHRPACPHELCKKQWMPLKTPRTPCFPQERMRHGQNVNPYSSKFFPTPTTQNQSSQAVAEISVPSGLLCGHFLGLLPRRTFAEQTEVCVTGGDGCYLAVETHTGKFLCKNILPNDTMRFCCCCSFLKKVLGNELASLGWQGGILD